MIRRPIVLSGGGCRGFAHLGVVKALQENSIYPSEISGTSAGAIAGAFLADGFTPDEIKDILIPNFNFRLLSWNGFKMGFASMKNVREFLQKNLRHTKFEDLSIPFHVTATNFTDGSQVVFNKGEMIEVILAACSIPIIFPPLFINNVPYVDGGLSNNLPIEPFNDRKSEVICVYVNPVKSFNHEESMTELMDRALHLSFRNIVKRSSEGCYMYIEPTDLSMFGIFDFHKTEEIFDIGYKFTMELLQGTKQP